MRKRAQSITEVKQQITGLKGEKLSLAVNRGRNRILTIDGSVVQTFPGVFTFKNTNGELASFAYSDVICGDIVFKLR